MKGYSSTTPMAGTKVLKNPKNKLVWDADKRRYMALILYMRDELYMEWKDIAWELHMLRSGGVPPTSDLKRDQWAFHRQKQVTEYYCYEWFYRDCCITDPAEVPYSETVLAYSNKHKKEMTKKILQHRAEISRKRREEEKQAKLLTWSYCN
jgi:hypothetical protein